jgi:high-affinity nickel permease
MFGILGLGFLLGMQHALEADHIAAVCSIAARRTNIGDIVRHGLTWGLGHTLALFVFALLFYVVTFVKGPGITVRGP